MLSIFYLEIISTTKTVSQKSKYDNRMGVLVNIVITSFYIFLFCLVIACQALGEQGKNQIAIEVYFVKNWFQLVTPYAPYKSRLTIFDISAVIICFILWVHCLVSLYIARESALIMVDEYTQKSLSRSVDMKLQRNVLESSSYFLGSEHSSGQFSETEESQVYRATLMKSAQSKPVSIIVFLMAVSLAMLNPQFY